MNAYLCTYCHTGPKPKDFRETCKEAETYPLLGEFLTEYPCSYYDWGDDPSFFAAQHVLGDVRMASWGVCRPDVRSAIRKGDVVVFFCGRKEKRAWQYYFIGYGTVRDTVARRACLWACQKYKNYRDFFNVLVGPRGEHREMVHPFHEDWRRRARAPYVIFDERSSSFNVTSPHCVGTWNGKSKHERWNSDRDPRSKEIERLLFIERRIKRRLRTSAKGYGHAKLNLLRKADCTLPRTSLPELLKALTPLVKG